MRVIPVNVETSGAGVLIFRTTDKVIHFYQYYSAMPSMGDKQHHLHFVTEDNVGEEEYGIDKRDMEVFKTTKGWPNHFPQHYYKIIATTDLDIHKDSGIPLIPESYVRKYAYHNGMLDHVELEEESVYIEPSAHIHSNRGEFKKVLKLNDEGEVIISGGTEIHPVEIIDWNQLTIDQLIEHLEGQFMFSSSGTAKAVFEVIRKLQDTQEGIRWVLKEYVENVNEEDAITEKLNKLLENTQIRKP